jgi:hypothetical protein
VAIYAPGLVANAKSSDALSAARSKFAPPAAGWRWN